ncbi:MAG: phosphate/phosphite/phosphonate ABC transporter substrate-binding protein [Chromatiales bacterium]|nr:phosphate/phosphite/phosphonate ABC transporter substrate-binding protein [Chromatiales bacterium]
MVRSAASRYRSVRDLDGETIAFPAPNALAASLLMRADLTRRIGIRFQPRYLTTHSLVYASVARGQVAAGGGVQQTFDAQPAALRAELRVLYRTRELPAHPIVAHARVPEAIRVRLRDALLAMGDCADGRARLARIPIDNPGAGRCQRRGADRPTRPRFVCRAERVTRRTSVPGKL